MVLRVLAYLLHPLCQALACLVPPGTAAVPVWLCTQGPPQTTLPATWLLLLGTRNGGSDSCRTRVPTSAQLGIGQCALHTSQHSSCVDGPIVPFGESCAHTSHLTALTARPQPACATSTVRIPLTTEPPKGGTAAKAARISCHGLLALRCRMAQLVTCHPHVCGLQAINLEQRGGPHLFEIPAFVRYLVWKTPHIFIEALSILERLRYPGQNWAV